MMVWLDRAGILPRPYNNILVRLLSYVLPRQRWYRTFYLYSRHWRTFRRTIGQVYGWQCERCGHGGMMDVHHKVYRLWREVDKDVELLCRECHKKEHKKS